MLDKARYIVVEGPFGVGKTSLARRLADHLAAPALLEKAEENPFLARFYQNMPRYALQTQLFFLFQRIELLGEQHWHDLFPDRVVSDFMFEKDNLFASLNLSDDEYRLYRQVQGALAPHPPKPDLVIYLQAEPGTLMDRLKRKSPGLERKVGEDYLARLAEAYAKFFYQYDAAPVFTLNAESLNPAEDDDDFRLLLERLTGMRGYREFFGYSN